MQRARGAVRRRRTLAKSTVISLVMGNVIAIVSIILALFAAGCIVYIARELTSKGNLPDAPEEHDREQDS